MSSKSQGCIFDWSLRKENAVEPIQNTISSLWAHLDLAEQKTKDKLNYRFQLSDTSRGIKWSKGAYHEDARRATSKLIRYLKLVWQSNHPIDHSRCPIGNLIWLILPNQCAQSWMIPYWLAIVPKNLSKACYVWGDEECTFVWRHAPPSDRAWGARGAKRDHGHTSEDLSREIWGRENSQGNTNRMPHRIRITREQWIRKYIFIEVEEWHESRMHTYLRLPCICCPTSITFMSSSFLSWRGSSLTLSPLSDTLQNT